MKWAVDIAGACIGIGDGSQTELESAMLTCMGGGSSSGRMDISWYFLICCVLVWIAGEVGLLLFTSLPYRHCPGFYIHPQLPFPAHQPSSDFKSRFSSICSAMVSTVGNAVRYALDRPYMQKVLSSVRISHTIEITFCKGLFQGCRCGWTIQVNLLLTWVGCDHERFTWIHNRCERGTIMLVPLLIICWYITYSKLGKFSKVNI